MAFIVLDALAGPTIETYRQKMGSWVIVAFYTAPVCVLAALTSLLSDPDFARLGRGWRGVRARLRRLRGVDDVSPPAGRPIEDIAYDARRLGRQLGHVNDGRSALRIGAIRAAYDDVLAEGCQALGLAHLLGVLPIGSELDAERERVEVALEAAGLVLEERI
jgi:hypothetical protein